MQEMNELAAAGDPSMHRVICCVVGNRLHFSRRGMPPLSCLAPRSAKAASDMVRGSILAFCFPSFCKERRLRQVGLLTFRLPRSVLGSGMNESPTVAAPLASSARLTLAQQTFERFGISCDRGA